MKVSETPREIDLLKKLKHPNIIHFIDSFKVDDLFAIITEYCEV